ncbi:MAG: cysteine desulfurase [Phycisphaerales bacterium]|nr:cysteine desulfurase [Phycisphaerales bacterium]
MSTQSRAGGLDIARLRSEFPALHQSVHGKPLVYLDNAATTHKPRSVIDATVRFYEQDNANVHRGLHALSARATQAYEMARDKVRGFINAADASECIFTSGVTDSLNLAAYTLGAGLKRGDRIVLSHMEHHSNIVPWQIVAGRVGAEVVPLPVTDRGELDLARAGEVIDERTKVVSCVFVSNTLGTINDVHRVCTLARAAGAVSVIDAAQAAAHLSIDVRAIGCDFLALTGHKMYGPTGIGVLYGRRALLDRLPPFRGGGEMIDQCTFAGTTFAPPPARFEAGTPNIAGAIGLGVAIDFLASQDRATWAEHEHELLVRATGALERVDGLRVVGRATHKIATVSFVLEWAHPYDVAPILDHAGVAVRTGHHCTQPLMDRLGLKATIRASMAAYNTAEEVDTLVAALHKARRMLAG